jgi:hypothetical protein
MYVYGCACIVIYVLVMICKSCDVLTALSIRISELHRAFPDHPLLSSFLRLIVVRIMILLYDSTTLRPKLSETIQRFC